MLRQIIASAIIIASTVSVANAGFFGFGSNEEATGVKEYSVISETQLKIYEGAYHKIIKICVRTNEHSNTGTPYIITMQGEKINTMVPAYEATTQGTPLLRPCNIE